MLGRPQAAQLLIFWSMHRPDKHLLVEQRPSVNGDDIGGDHGRR
jgi:hypothetical protein